MLCAMKKALFVALGLLLVLGLFSILWETRTVSAREQMLRHPLARLIPDYVEYDPPAPFFRAHPYKGEQKPEYYHPKNGSVELEASLRFRFVPVGVWVGEGKRVMQRSVTWQDLRDEVQKKSKIVGGSAQLSEPVLDGKRVLMFDYRQHVNPGSSWKEFHITYLWFPVDDNLVLEGAIVCSSEELWQALRAQLLKIKIRKHRALRG